MLFKETLIFIGCFISSIIKMVLIKSTGHW